MQTRLPSLDEQSAPFGSSEALVDGAPGSLLLTDPPYCSQMPGLNLRTQPHPQWPLKEVGQGGGVLVLTHPDV